MGRWYLELIACKDRSCRNLKYFYVTECELGWWLARLGMKIDRVGGVAAKSGSTPLWLVHRQTDQIASPSFNWDCVNYCSWEIALFVYRIMQRRSISFQKTFSLCSFQVKIQVWVLMYSKQKKSNMHLKYLRWSQCQQNTGLQKLRTLQTVNAYTFQQKNNLKG